MQILPLAHRVRNLNAIVVAALTPLLRFASPSATAPAGIFYEADDYGFPVAVRTTNLRKSIASESLLPAPAIHCEFRYAFN